MHLDNVIYDVTYEVVGEIIGEFPDDVWADDEFEDLFDTLSEELFDDVCVASESYGGSDDYNEFFNEHSDEIIRAWVATVSKKLPCESFGDIEDLIYGITSKAGHLSSELPDDIEAFIEEIAIYL